MAAGEAITTLPAAAREHSRQGLTAEKLTVHQLLRRTADRYVSEHRDGEATMSVQSALAKISLCRSSALGGHWYQCDDCQRVTKLHNSCGDRHCPGCSGGKRQDFSERAGKMLLEGVDYYQVVFTLPEVISTMALANRKEIAELLFSSAWKALGKTIRSEQGYDPAALMVLHTWNQKLDSHWHVHALVPGGGPTLDDGSWTAATAPVVEGLDDARSYLVDAINLRSSFRKFAIANLQRLRKGGKLKLGGSLDYLHSDEGWDSMIDELKQTEWCSYIEPPPCESSRPEHVVRYLTRYLTGGPISDQRILAANEKEVTFLARQGETTGGQRDQVPHSLPTMEFVRRWCMHIQPDQLTKTRYFGGWSNIRKDVYLERCCRALDAAEIGIDSEVEFDPAAWDVSCLESRRTELVCDHCGSDSLRLIKEIDKPTWESIFARNSQCSPLWYRTSQENDDIRYWDSAMGGGFSDWYAWYLKSGIESARESETACGRSVQFRLPGLSE